MLYNITQRLMASDEILRTFAIDLRVDHYLIATDLGLKFIVEIGQELIAVICSWGDYELVSSAKLTIDGCTMFGRADLPTLHEACLRLIQEAHAKSI